MVHLKDPTNLAHLLNGQLHRIPPEQLEQTVKDYDLLAGIIHGCFNGSVDFKIMDRLINNIQEKVFQVKEYTRSAGSNKVTYTHDEQTLADLIPTIRNASQKIFANIFPESDISNWHDVKLGTSKFDEKFKKLRLSIKDAYLRVRSKPNKSYKELLDDIEARYNKAARNTTDERIIKYLSMGDQAATLFFFANNRHLPFVQVNNPYSKEKSSQEAAKQHYELAIATMGILISNIEQLYQEPNVDPESITKNLTNIHFYLTEHEDYLNAFIENGLFNILKSTINLKRISDKTYRRTIRQMLEEIEEVIYPDRKNNKVNNIKSKLSRIATKGKSAFNKIIRNHRDPNKVDREPNN